MATLLLQQTRPMNRKQRLLEYLNIQRSDNSKTKPNEKQIDKDIEAVFEELIADSDDAVYVTDLKVTENIQVNPTLQINSESENLKSPLAKRRRLSEIEAEDFEKYCEKYESVVETANFLHQQLQDVANDGIILSEDTDVSYDDVESVSVVREHSPIQRNKRKRRATKKPVKRILHVTGDSTLEYFEDCQTVDDVEALEHQESPPIQQKKKKRRVIKKKSYTNFVHITGDSPTHKSYIKKSSPSSSDTDDEAIQLSPSNSILYPFVPDTDPQNIIIGPNKTSVDINDFENIDWNLSAPIVTRKLLLYIFGRDILSTHSLTGKPSPAFLDQNKPLKKPLDPKKVADIIFIVTQKKNVKAKEVRLTITSKCADEQKMRRARMSK
ncbi:uncharacterized protein LOC129952559 [Eupeodes corollae]|uniref:uncharacterized protein LOC129952559 n=1 Tax=Eupeodes corollae TaxID=290404 RepID=UPI0024920E8D|nr:uncharacterized protein LOC129952559 [Eupeodes corollae]